MRIRQMGFKMQKIEAIFISHLHGDHFFGLIGLLSTFSLLGRTKELAIIAPKDLEPWIFQTLRISDSYLTFPVQFVATEKNQSGTVYETDFLTVKAVPVKHRIDVDTLPVVVWNLDHLSSKDIGRIEKLVIPSIWPYCNSETHKKRLRGELAW
jgi:ribonuclease BN (tRNA processing enzyme)